MEMKSSFYPLGNLKIYSRKFWAILYFVKVYYDLEIYTRKHLKNLVIKYLIIKFSSVS